MKVGLFGHVAWTRGVGHERSVEMRAKRHSHTKAPAVRSRRIRRASMEQSIEQQDYCPRWRTPLYKPPPSQGLQAINLFDDTPDTRNGRDIYQLVQFYQT